MRKFNIPKVSVIVAVYNVEVYLERCLHSLFQQTLESIEYVFVDDASNDNSIELLKKVMEQYPHRKEQVKIIRHEQNRGVAAARTTGILAATGEYMIHCDSDDYVDLEAYEEMYDVAEGKNVDIVFCDYIKHKMDSEEVKAMNYDSECIENLKRPAHHGLISTLWNVLVRSSIIKDNKLLPFPGGDMGEDHVLMLRILYFAKSFSCINKPFYHYCIRKNSVTTGTSYLQKLKKFHINIEGLCEFYTIKKETRYLRYCDYLKLNAKLELKEGFVGKDREWFELYRDAHPRMLSLPNNPLKVRILWRLLFSNYILYKSAKVLYRLVKGKNL